MHDPRRRLAVPPGRHHAVPGPHRHLRAGDRPAVPAARAWPACPPDPTVSYRFRRPRAGWHGGVFAACDFSVRSGGRVRIASGAAHVATALSALSSGAVLRPARFRRAAGLPAAGRPAAAARLSAAPPPPTPQPTATAARCTAASSTGSAIRRLAVRGSAVRRPAVRGSAIRRPAVRPAVRCGSAVRRRSAVRLRPVPRHAAAHRAAQEEVVGAEDRADRGRRDRGALRRRRRRPVLRRQGQGRAGVRRHQDLRGGARDAGRPREGHRPDAAGQRVASWTAS